MQSFSAGYGRVKMQKFSEKGRKFFEKLWNFLGV